MTESNLLIRIRMAYDQLTKLEKKVADYVLANPRQVVKMTIAELAASCGVGDTTVFRFCRTLALSGYQDFKLSLALSADINEMLDSNENVSITESKDLQALALNVSTVIRDTIDETVAALDYDAVSRTVDAILNACSVNLYGFGNSGIAAQLMQNRFMRLISNVFYVGDVHMQLTSAALLRPNSVAIIFCNSGVTKDSIRITQMAQQAGATTVFITKFLQTPAAAYADILLPCGATEGPMQGGSIAVLASQQYIVSLLYSELFRRIGDEGRESKIKAAQAIAERKL
ncbi:MurR/RpiR family transcriptional regulator [Eubacteriales bacterium OttesenSCG-928-A19]|nr:MurR/RpiR family transcriptional regulator [Eubacteriales bacterium OttesenSCG-928-A19]